LYCQQPGFLFFDLILLYAALLCLHR